MQLATSELPELRPGPYLRLVHSVPQTASDSAIINGTRVARHPNGGGLVTCTATVASSVFVGSDAEVCDITMARGEVRVMHRGVIAGSADASGSGCIRDDARVDGCAVPHNRITVR